jgi:hypothetical protein
MPAPVTRHHRPDEFDGDEDRAVPDDRAGSGVLGEPMAATGSIVNQGAMIATGSMGAKRASGSTPAPVTTGSIGATGSMGPRTEPGSMTAASSMPKLGAMTTLRTRTTMGSVPTQVTWKQRLDGDDGDEDDAVAVRDAGVDPVTFAAVTRSAPSMRPTPSSTPMPPPPASSTLPAVELVATKEVSVAPPRRSPRPRGGHRRRCGRLAGRRDRRREAGVGHGGTKSTT